ncbi:MAG: hypothetical protein GAK30_01038 [Paracidovorax wautersii]|uniref:Bleomycin resistance protein n=1 Tax=Paracidovorax wautersii TaxID=1177982 RepID=A0A7V8FQW6_9BURK|nr:MAG: hypothetical protein GAK30_01038 [Paracidovorax wautersii]
MARLVPELLVVDLAASLSFWCDLCGFRVRYDRPEEGFAYLDLAGAQLMLEQIGGRNWVTGPLQPPLGRGINLQITVTDVMAIQQRLAHANWPLFMEVEDKWYRIQGGAGAQVVETGLRQFLVQDPDGYLARFASSLGVRHVPASVA